MLAQPSSTAAWCEELRKEISMSGQPTSAREAFGDIAPALADYTDKLLFGDV